MRVCADCPADISNRTPPTKRCYECARVRRTKLDNASRRKRKQNPVYLADLNNKRRWQSAAWYARFKKERPEAYARYLEKQRAWWAKNGKALDAKRKGKRKPGAISEQAKNKPPVWIPFNVPDYLKG